MLKAATLFLAIAVGSLLLRAFHFGAVVDLLAAITFFLGTVAAVACVVLGVLSHGAD